MNQGELFEIRPVELRTCRGRDIGSTGERQAIGVTK